MPSRRCDDGLVATVVPAEKRGADLKHLGDLTLLGCEECRTWVNIETDSSDPFPHGKGCPRAVGAAPLFEQ